MRGKSKRRPARRRETAKRPATLAASAKVLCFEVGGWSAIVEKVRPGQVTISRGADLIEVVPSLEACQLGLALLEASRVAGAYRAGAERRATSRTRK